MSTRPVLRFAPSPNGLLHLGHAFSALTTCALAQRLGGRFLVRIEDIDLTRSRPELIEATFADLAWLGLEWETPVLRQSEHFPVYSQALAKLDALGVVYRCPATRNEILAAAQRTSPMPTDPDGAPLYPGLGGILGAAEVERRIASGAPYALRLDMGRALTVAQARLGRTLTFTELSEEGLGRDCICHPGRWGDVVLARKDTPASYHLCVVVDDARQGITHVMRGQDLFAATDVHRLLQVLLGLPAPLYQHHRLILGQDGRKLSKSAGDTSLRALRAAGWTPDDVRAAVGIET